ncbi:interferon-induced protein with tetratricopeptide repeats 1-like [Alosa alosa]|uniref:interferon-induced protein with tetratricopeptide repeats 1-like n=1 Tax=Alosa alosa TaxID=278164 RepID=UPI0020154AB6|nr:interferon-induced protein with tetratricopeptide repeats 1-like [Alosa alosa]
MEHMISIFNTRGVISCAFDLQGHLENMECHFNWQLDCSPSKLENLHQDLKDRIYFGCNWMCQLHSLLGYILHALGSRDEALTHLKEAEKMIKEGDEEKDCLLLVNQANLAWVHYFRGELTESRAYLEEVTRLQEALPAPSGSQIHPELSAQKGWALLMFERNHQQRAIECFKMAVTSDPTKRLFRKGLVLAMDKVYFGQPLTPDLRREITDNLRVVKQMDENDVWVATLYLINALRNGEDREQFRQQVNTLADKLIASRHLDGLSNVLFLLGSYFSEYDKALDVAETMLEQFPDSIIAKKNLASSLKWKVFSLRKKTEERTVLATRAIGIYEEVNTKHSVKENISLAKMHVNVGNTDAANHIYKSLLDQKNISDTEKQFLFFQYGEYLNWERKMTSEAIDMYIKAVQVPVVSDYRDKCFQKLVSIVKSGRHKRCDEIYSSLFDLPYVGRRHNGQLFLKK